MSNYYSAEEDMQTDARKQAALTHAARRRVYYFYFIICKTVENSIKRVDSFFGSGMPH